MNPGFYKALVLDFFTIASAIFVGYAYRNHLIGVYDLATVLLASAILVIFSALQIFLTKEFGRRFFVLLLETAAILAFFHDYNLRLLSIAAAVMLIIPLIGEIMSRRELANGLDIRFFKVSKPALAKLTTALIIVFIILYIPQWTPGNAFLSEESFSGFVDWLSVVAGGLYPDIRFNAPISQLIEGVTRAQLKNDIAFQKLSPNIQEDIVRQTASKFTEGLSSGIGVAILPEAPAAKVMHQYITSTLEGWRNHFGNAFVAVWGVAAFFVVRGFGVIFHWLAAFLSFIFYEILLAAGFFHTNGETRTHEVIEW